MLLVVRLVCLACSTHPMSEQLQCGP